ncbi:RagB/SusD family nutrient uptake outer membrane protein [Echinicola soli]|uniref:RagB/SusD family nutrient uptake outer membrane protein n=1 Tax=Echinicola soli TaxID=2591634 RepID=A0A514CMC5_9BACT|nr:RagB/SusD family nutrient uptake outer membrane protein [Echinicola soli]QDH80975.1 RagB/SusD family nutrient uptake outer membrane protein [Echinicola soli]
MRNIKKLFGSIALASVVAAGCAELDQYPEATTSKSAVFNSENGLNLYANSFYNALPTARNIHSGDEMADYAARTQVPDFIRPGNFNPSQSSGWNWEDLRNINYFLENNNSEEVGKETRDHFNALARFFRAFFYFEKVKRFGDVPWINTPMSVDDPALFDGRDPRTLVMDSVLADLDYAIANIGEEEDESRSLITKNVVLGIKSRICLFEGTFRKYHEDYELTSSVEKWLNEAASAAKQVMDNGNFSLYKSAGEDFSYRSLFISEKPVAQEIMLAVVIDPSLSIFHDANWWWTSSTYGARVSLTRDFIRTYLNEDGTPFTELSGHETMTFMEETENRDKRLQQTIRMGDYTRVNAGTVVPAPPIFSYTYTGYQPIKWTLDDMYFDGGNRNTNSVSILRYAEVLLNYAEARAELGEFTEADWILTIGALRERAGITGNLSMPTMSDPYLQQTYFPEITDPVLLEIRRERGIELVLEGFRFYDIVRWNKGELMEMPWNGFYVPALNTPLDLNEDGILDVAFYTQLPSSQVDGVTYINVSKNLDSGINPQQLEEGNKGEIQWLDHQPRKWEEKNYLYPIPENDLLMNPALGQNPGW